MEDYNLKFISNKNLYFIVKETILSYKEIKVDLDKFNKNIIDPIKLNFDLSVYNMSFELLIELECLRQFDRSHSNIIGHFHQRIFPYISKKWEIPKIKNGFDLINEEKNIYVEIKNKYNTMNGDSGTKKYKEMENILKENNKATCYLVEVISKKSYNKIWYCSYDKKRHSNDKIRKISIDLFYEIVTGDELAFYKLCDKLPNVIEDVVKEIGYANLHSDTLRNFTISGIENIKDLYTLAFKKYKGF